MTHEPVPNTLDAAIAAYLLADEQGQAPNRAEFVAHHPEWASQLQEFFADHDRLCGAAAPLRHPPDGVPPEGRSTAPRGEPAATVVGIDGPVDFSVNEFPRFGDYDLEAELARGGMGVVYRARQRSLNRIVALKTMRAGASAGSVDRLRFRAEAEAVALLEHPHIVPIYEVGEHAGQPYFSMKLYEGGSLAQHIGRYRDDPRAAGRLVATVASAVHHAHQRGILHRDLKPGNILLDAEQQPHVSDFGLAKRLEPEAGAAALTETGAILGTPHYMAPEQALNPSGGVTTAADIYSLGAILYELLTGRTPFRGTHILEILQKVRETEPDRPRSLNPKVEPDLETICLKCLRKDPTARYAAADGLADDLRRYLDGESIQARPRTRGEQAWRWCRRQPHVAALSLALIVAVLVGAILIPWGWWQAVEYAHSEAKARAAADDERQKADGERQKAENERRRAEAQAERSRGLFKLAHQALTDLGRSLGESPNELTPNQRELAKRALAYYQELLREAGDDPAVQAGAAEIYRLVGRLTRDTGSRTEALAAYQKSLELTEAALKERPQDRTLRNQIAQTNYTIAKFQIEGGSVVDGEISLRRSKTLYEALLDEQPDDPATLEGLGNALVFLAFRLRALPAKRGEALALLRQAQTLIERRLRQQPNNPNSILRQAYLDNHIGALLALDSPKAKEALEHFEKARAARQKVADQFPQRSDYRRDVGESHQNIGSLLLNMGRPGEAQTSLLKAHEIFNQLTAEFPTNIQYRRDLGGVHAYLGRLNASTGKPAEALAEYQRAAAVQEQLVREFPELRTYIADLAATTYYLALYQNRLGQKPDAEASYRRSQGLAEKLLNEDPDTAEVRDRLGMTLNNLAILVGQSGRLKEGTALAQSGVDHARKLCNQAPDTPLFRRHLANNLATLGDLERASGRFAQAVATFVEIRKMGADDPAQLFDLAKDLAITAKRAAERAQTAEQGRDAEGYADLAAATLRDAVAAGFRDAARLRQEPTFANLRDREDVRKLLEKLESAPAP